MFTDKEHRGPFEFSDEIANLSIGAESADTVVPAHRVEANDKDLLLGSEEEETRGPNNGGAYSAPSYDNSLVSLATTQTQPDVAISNPTVPGHAPQSSLAIDDLLGLGAPAATAPAPAPAPAPSPPPLKLNSKAVLDPSTFQQKWRQLPISLSQVFVLVYSGIYLIEMQYFIVNLRLYGVIWCRSTL